MKPIIIAVLILCSISAFSQINKVYKYKAVRYAMVFNDDNNDFVSITPYKDTSMLVVVNVPDRSITFYGDTNKKYDITKETTVYVDAPFNFLKWQSCIDPDGRRCNIRIAMPTGDISGIGLIMYIDYRGVTYYYGLKYN